MFDQPFGCLPRTDCLGDRFEICEESDLPQIDERDWPAVCQMAFWPTRLLRHVFNQGREGSCVGNGTTQGVDLVGHQAFGAIFPLLSPMSLYRRIGANSQSGAQIGDALREAQQRGILPLDTPENRKRFKHCHPATGWDRRLPNGWEETGCQIRIDEALDIGTKKGFFSALAGGHPVVYGRDRHCIVAAAARYMNNELQIGFIQSYGLPWGPAGDGIGWDPWPVVAAGLPVYGAFAIRSLVTPDWAYEIAG